MGQEEPVRVKLEAVSIGTAAWLRLSLLLTVAAIPAAVVFSVAVFVIWTLALGFGLQKG